MFALPRGPWCRPLLGASQHFLPSPLQGRSDRRLRTQTLERLHPFAAIATLDQLISLSTFHIFICKMQIIVTQKTVMRIKGINNKQST